MSEGIPEIDIRTEHTKRTAAPYASIWSHLAGVNGWKVLQWLIFGLSCVFLYFTLASPDIRLQWEAVGQKMSLQNNMMYVIAAILLIPVNWGLEALKWRMMILPLQRISYLRSFAAVLAGTSISLWVPNRLGEYAGRVLFIKEKMRVKGIMGTLLTSTSQLIVTLVMGLAGLCLLITKLGAEPLLRPLVWLSASISIIALLVFYFRIKYLYALLPRHPKLLPVKKTLLAFRSFSGALPAKILGLSLIRYLVFCVQFSLLALFFGVELPWLQMMTAIFVIYLLQSIIPTNSLTELGVRGVAAGLFGGLAGVQAQALTASFSLWAMNVLLPAVIGLIILAMGARQKQ